MKTFFIFFNIILFQNNLISQLPTITWTEQDKEKFKPSYYLKMSNGDLVTITENTMKFKMGKIDIKVFDSKGKLIKEIENKEWQNPAWDSKNYYLQDAKVVEDRICLIVLEHKDKKIFIYKNTLTKDYKAGNDLKFIGEVERGKSANSMSFFHVILGILTLNPMVFAMGAEVDPSAYFLTRSESFDKSKYLLSKPYYSKDKKLIYQGICLDSKLNKIYQTNHELAKGEKEGHTQNNFLLTNNGDIIFSHTKVYKKHSDKNKRNITCINRIQDKGKRIIKSEFEGDKAEYCYINSESNLSLDESIITNFHSIAKEKLDTRLDGFSIIQIDANSLKLIKKDDKSIDEQLLSLVYNVKETKKGKIGKKGMKNNWKHINIHSFSDNSFLVLLQEYDRIVHTTTRSNSNGSVSTSTYVELMVGDILMMKYSADRTLEWRKVLYKTLNGSEMAEDVLLPSSYMFNDKVYLIYNDNSSNIALQGASGMGSKTVVKSRNKILKLDGVIKTISSSGEINGKVLLNGAKSDEAMISSNFIKLNNETILLKAFKNKKQRFGIMNLDKSTASNMSNSAQGSNLKNNENLEQTKNSDTKKSVMERLDVKNKDNPSDEILDKIRKMKEDAERELNEAK